MKIYDVYDAEFKDYGCVIEGYAAEQFLEVLAQRECPDGVVYKPSDKELEGLPAAKEIQETLCGRMPIQIGYTNGHCRKMNALEYHKSSEINVADQDIILFLALRQELDESFRMDTDKVKAFRVPRGVMVEIYATTMHYAPCQTTDAGYRCIVILPRGTNLPVKIQTEAKGEHRLMTATNKWLLGHPEGGLEEGTYMGLTGKNLEV
ncbi:MAG: DUF4867 family protein [Eubacteriales bacterium]|nr:DUF4867 family protein [Eubacteriales bacterium]